jgi:Mg2+/Co2+ transporter CorC
MRERPDHIVGIANVKDLVRVQHGDRRAATIRGLMREAHAVPDTLRLGALLQQFRASASTWPSSSTSTAARPGW